MRALGITFIALSVLSLSACSGSSDESGDGSGDGGSGSGEIKILVSAPLTGDFAETGEDIVNGAELAADYLNEQGGIQSGPHEGAQIVIDTADDEMSTEAASTIASRYVSDESIWALMGFLSSGQAQAAGTVADRAGLGVFSSYSCADFLTSEADNIVVMCASLDTIARSATNFAVEDLGAEKLGSIGGDYSLMDSYYEGIDAELGDAGLESVAREVYPVGTSDFSTSITNLDSAGVDAIMSGSYQADAGQILSQVRQAGIDVPFVDFMGEGWGQTFLDTAGPAASENAYGLDAAFALGGPTEELAEEMSSQYDEQFGKAMPPSAAHAFDTVLTIANGIEAGAEDRGELLDYVKDASGEGLIGPMEFTDELRPTTRYLSVVKITGTDLTDRETVARYELHGDRTISQVEIDG